MTRITTMSMMRTYSELIQIPTYEERFEYLQLHGEVGKDTFGFDRYLNQKFYRSTEWRQLRNSIVVRDKACDMACKDYEIYDRIVIHHLNPITVDDFINNRDSIMDPEFLVCVSPLTHKAIHFGDFELINQTYTERRRGDTTLW